MYFVCCLFSYGEASIALGATKARTIPRVVLPYATGSIITGTALGSQWVMTNLNHPFPSITVQISDYARSSYKGRNHIAIGRMRVLIGLIFLLNLGIRLIARTLRAAT